ncbi:unnamed protein product [Spirodela intermedia]|uniref:SBP-type domain-containing protein n=1 Tax=Spirodela intermedia TaxID=51605 RepID=A0A7I8I8I0_SPIIN|nr:unnamed protein product [Spirodela intermedia]CAA6653939.1 unnamed protein product [Spirodela intermedia]
MTRAGKNVEWDLNDWSWDGHLFVATPLNGSLSNCGNKQLFPAPAVGELPNCSVSFSGDSEPGSSGRGRGESEKRRREVVVVDQDEPDDVAGSLTLNLGGRVYPVTEPTDPADWEGNNGKRSKMQASSCGADLSEAKDYHRRHKVCEMHAKASKAVVGNVQQRFCQQCSRDMVHDGGKPSKSRAEYPQKVTRWEMQNWRSNTDWKEKLPSTVSWTQQTEAESSTDAVVNGTSLMDDRTISYLLISLLRILTNLHSGGSEVLKDQDLLSHLLKSLASLSGSLDTNKLTGLFQSSQEQEILDGNATEGEHGGSICGEMVQAVPCNRPTNLEPAQEVIPIEKDGFSSLKRILPTVEGARIRSFDLNNVCSDGPESTDEPDHLFIPESRQQDSPCHLPWAAQKSNKTSPPQTLVFQILHPHDHCSLSMESRTDRMVFKLFGKDPSDFPLVLRSQILDWLSNSPTDMEGYIRPGCLILTVYLRLAESTWEELSHNLKPSLEKLLAMAGDDFWQTGWLYATIQHQIAFVLNGCVVLDTPALLDAHNHCELLSVSPIAVCASEGSDLQSKLRRRPKLSPANDASAGGSQRVQCLHFSCSVPSGTGRGFVEVEDHALRSSFFPFIVAEETVSAEICTLEGVINENYDDMASGAEARKRALDFLHEMGWLLRKAHLRFCSLGAAEDSDAGFYPLVRFRRLMEFSIDQNWRAVVKKLLDVLFSGAVVVDSNSLDLALSEMSLLHSAVQRNRSPIVELLLSYVPSISEGAQSEEGRHPRSFLFRPDMPGPFDVTPLHIAASRADAEGVLDALTDDPAQVGIKAWTGARDSSGFTPEDYAHLRGYESYTQLVQRKISRASEPPGRRHRHRRRYGLGEPQ